MENDQKRKTDLSATSIISRSLVFFLFSALVASFASAEQSALPTTEQRHAMFRALTSEIERLDGIALTVRANRPEAWRTTVDKLEADFAAAKTTTEIARVFNRLDQTYPSLHAYNELGPDLEQAMPHRIRAAVGFDTDWIAPTFTRFRIARVDASLVIDDRDRPQVGDELLAINGHEMKAWTDENFIFCKFALKEQCDFDLTSQFFSELLSWERSQPLTYTVKRGDRIWTINIPIADAPPKPAKDPRRLECATEPLRYPGFTLAYSGNRACIFISENDPTIAILRITSFQYRLLAPEQSIRNMDQEIQALLPWWQSHATWSHLVIDVIDNGGGNAPIPYYKLLLQKDFQEQYVQFRKGPELESTKLRMDDNGLFWGSHAHELWFQKILKNGTWDATATYEFLPPVPQFCADDDKGCVEDLFHPYEHPFRGRVSIMLNQLCVSSCDGFVWQLKDKLNARLFGHPQAADPAYARLTIRVYLDQKEPNGFRLETGPIREQLPVQPWVSQTVYVTRSTSSSGDILDGKPLPLDGFVPWTIENSKSWVQTVLSAALLPVTAIH